MLQYVNGFSCAVDSEKEEFIINFVQRIPKINENGIQEELTTETVSSIVMGVAVAERLLDTLEEMLEGQPDEEKTDQEKDIESDESLINVKM